ncbi:MAG: AAA family ATPase [Thermodesulfobacteriota bacterium]
MQQANLFVFMGLIASGKSTLARAFAEKLFLPCYNTDMVRKELAGFSSSSRQGNAFNQGIYTPEFSRRTYDALLAHARRELRQGRSLVLDGSYHKRAERERLRQCAEECDATLSVILCQCDDAETERRLVRRARDPLAVSDGTWEIYQRQKESMEFPGEMPADDLVIIETNGPVPVVLAGVLARLAQKSRLPSLEVMTDE